MGGSGRRRSGALHGLVGGGAMNEAILSLVTFVPVAGALLLLFFPSGRDEAGHDPHDERGPDPRNRAIRWFALGVSLLDLLLSLHLPVHFERGTPGFQFELNVPWIPTPAIRYHLGVDGISLWLVVLTTFLVPLCVLIS